MKRPTKRMVKAREALLDAATELASLVTSGDSDHIGRLLGHGGPTALSIAIADVYNANDEWQEAQLRGAAS